MKRLVGATATRLPGYEVPFVEMALPNVPPPPQVVGSSGVLVSCHRAVTDAPVLPLSSIDARCSATLSVGSAPVQGVIPLLVSPLLVIMVHGLTIVCGTMGLPKNRTRSCMLS